MPLLRQLFAYLIVSFFLLYVLLSGIENSVNQVLQYFLGLPDFSHYHELRTLDPHEFPTGDPTRKVIIVGDIHGMIGPLRNLLDKVNYVPPRDVLVHVGDVITKAPLHDSLKVLDFLSSHNITGVRGNHDQKVIEWRGWITWIISRSGGDDWLKRLERKWRVALEKDSNVDLDLWLEKERSETDNHDKKWWALVPQGWVPLSDHYNIAKGMSERDFAYLLKLPLRLYIPHVHAFIVHAGMLPADPRYPLDDEKQPMARVPHGRRRRHEDIEELRQIQELNLLSQVPQNKDPWVVLNMRAILDGKVVKKAKKGTYWTKIWQEQMESCAGFDGHGLEFEGKHQDIIMDPDNFTLRAELEARKHHKLPCYPASTIYGHTASRGLDINRWTFGLDSGCIYKRHLSSLVIGGELPVTPTEETDITDIEGDREDIAIGTKPHISRTKFGDNLEARIVTVKC